MKPPRDEEFCVWFKQATDHGAIEKVKAEEQDLRDAILNLIREDPALLDDIERAQDYDDVLTIPAETAVPLIEATGTNQQWTFEIRGDDRRYNLVTAASSTHDRVYRPTTHRLPG